MGQIYFAPTPDNSVKKGDGPNYAASGKIDLSPFQMVPFTTGLNAVRLSRNATLPRP